MDKSMFNNEVYANRSIITDTLIINNSKKKVARRRWGILAKALKSPSGSEPTSPTDEYSVRRISSFMLLKTQQIENIHVPELDNFLIILASKRIWYKYSMLVEGIEYYVNVGHRIRTFSAEDLMGFNNTGNICIWPSEETLSFYVASNLHIFKNKSIIELGGGMSCLAGLFCAKYGAPQEVLLTDGNKISVENVHISLAFNNFDCPVNCSVLKWSEYSGQNKFDIILCADCLFFDEARADLIGCLWELLKQDGLALIMAPRRGHTLNSFLVQCIQKGFLYNEVITYNNVVWEKHLQLLDNCDYDENIHYPVLIELTKL